MDREVDAIAVYDLLKSYDDAILAGIEASAALRMIALIERKLHRSFVAEGNEKKAAEMLVALKRVTKRKSSYQEALLLNQGEARRLMKLINLIEED